MALPLDWVPDPVQQRNNDLISGELRLPVPQARVYNDAALTIATATGTNLTFNSERYDEGGFHSTAANTDRLVAPITGLYLMTGHIQWASNATGVRGILIFLNDATVIAWDTDAAVSGSVMEQSISTLYRLTAGNYVTLRVFQNSGGNLNVNAAGNYSPEFSIVRLAGFTAQTVEA